MMDWGGGRTTVQATPPAILPVCQLQLSRVRQATDEGCVQGEQECGGGKEGAGAGAGGFEPVALVEGESRISAVKSGGGGRGEGADIWERE